MPSSYPGRHRTAPASGRHRAPARHPSASVKPIAVSAISLGATLAVVPTIMQSPFGEIPQANAADNTMALTVAGSRLHGLDEAIVAKPAVALPAAQVTSAAAVTPAASEDAEVLAVAEVPTSKPVNPTPAATRASTTTTATTTTTAAPAPPPPPPPPAPKVDPAKAWLLPCGGPITSGFGPRWGTFHYGLDFGVNVGTPLHALSSGVVKYAGWMSGYGYLVQVRYWDGTISYFGHMDSIAVSVGQAVDPGQVVGRSGNTGDSTGPHLHLEIHPDGGPAVDPAGWLKTHGLTVG